MRLSKRDTMATGLVATAVMIFVLFAVEAISQTDAGVRMAGVGILLLGFIASATAVVPSFLDLLHGSRSYLIGMSVLGVVALVAGVHVLVAASGSSLGVLVAVLIVLWLLATIHHSRGEGAGHSNHPTARPIG